MRADDAIRLRHILDAIQQATQFLQGRSKEDLQADAQLRLALIKCVEIVGEAAARLSLETQQLNPQIPWREIVAMRNRLIHTYFDVNLNILWKTVEHDLPLLKLGIERIVDKTPG
jgi:uncharacterized protein with HEPN domain